jgi:hypothetical protein
LINRDPLTSIFEPEKWNKNCLVVDAWSGSVYTQAGFVLINTKVPHYGISNNIKGDTQHIIKYAGGKIWYCFVGEKNDYYTLFNFFIHSFKFY